MAQRNFRPKHRNPSTKTFNGRRAIDRLYDNDWQRYCRRFLAINPWCYACGKPGNTVDHLVPHQGDEKLFKKMDNHIPLCTKCHNTVTSLFDRKYRAGNPVTAKIEWLNSRRSPGSGNFPRVKVLPSYL